ncbi:M48 family metallopeptidase [Hephaestia sp. GCM10023244]|uniref:M48 family metallopeptidase n=1 Tax=unclassified Hephaestia TaxID=2631281 RepID=UPI0020771B2D|nr:M48 family metallopeptidase [Hephaestia sp. MAHUQ-44]
MAPAIRIVRHARARRARLSIDPTSGEARLTVPARGSVNAALRWAETQRAWIAAQQSRLPEPRPFAPGAEIPFGDTRLIVDWDAALPRRVTRDGDRLVCGGPADGLARRITTWLRREALNILSGDTAYYAARAGVVVTQVTVGDPRGRWGSCAASGAIRYSWRLVLAPEHVRRATVAHEVAHRLHMDHSPAFHAAAARILGDDPAPARVWLRTHGAALHWIGRDV